VNAASHLRAPAARESKGTFGQLLLQDAARRSLRWSVPIALVLGLIIRAGAGETITGWKQLPFAVHNAKFAYLYIEIWLAVLFAVIIAHFNSRCSALNLALPVSPRTLWYARVVAIAGAALIPIAIVVVATASANPDGALGLDLPLLPIGLRTAAGFALAVVLFQLPSPGVHRIAGKRSYVIYVAVVSAAVLAYTITTPGAWVFDAAPFVAAMTIALAVSARLPLGFDLSQTDPTPDVPAPSRDDRAAAHRAPLEVARRRGNIGRAWRLLLVIWRENLNAWPSWVMTLLIFFTVWSLTAAYYRVNHPLYEYVTLLLWCWVLVCQSVQRLNRLDYLPVRRSVVFYSVVLFMAIPSGLGFLAGYVVDNRLNDSPRTQVCYCGYTVRVPFDAWEIAWDGKAPEVSSPWGETYAPSAARLFKSLSRVAVYNPFEPGKKSSPALVALQIDRAVARVHGPQAVQPRMSDVARDSSFIEAVARGEYTVASSLRRDSDLRIRTNAVILMMWFVMFVLVNAVWWRRYGPEADFVRARWFAILFFGIPYAFLIGSAVLTARGMLNDWAILAFQMVVLRSVAEVIPVGTGLLWVLTVAVGIACAIVLGRRYAGAEAPAQQSGKHLLSEY
jgi:hypothetical protein